MQMACLWPKPGFLDLGWVVRRIAFSLRRTIARGSDAPGGIADAADRAINAPPLGAGMNFSEEDMEGYTVVSVTRKSREKLCHVIGRMGRNRNSEDECVDRAALAQTRWRRWISQAWALLKKKVLLGTEGSSESATSLISSRDPHTCQGMSCGCD